MEGEVAVVRVLNSRVQPRYGLQVLLRATFTIIRPAIRFQSEVLQLPVEK